MEDNDNYFDSNEFKELLERYEAAAENGHSSYFEPDELAHIAEYYQSNGDTGRAIALLDDALQSFPGATAPLLLRSRIALITERDAEKARQYADEISDKSDLDYYYLQAEIMLAEDNAEEADSYLEDKYSLLDDDDMEDFAFDVADLYADYGYADGLRRWLPRITDTDSDDYIDLLAGLKMYDGQYEEAEQLFKELTEREPFSSYYWNQLANAQIMQGKMRESIQSSEFAIAIDPNDGDAIMNKANGLFSIHNSEGALEYYQRYAHLNPQNYTAEALIGGILSDLGRYEEALQHLEKAVAMAEGNDIHQGEIYKQLAFTYSCAKDKDKAFEAIEKAIEKGAFTNSEAKVVKGYIMLQQQDTKESLKYFSEAMEQSGNDPKILFRIAVAAFENGYLAMCYKLLKLLFKVAPDGWNDGFAYMAYCCLALKKDKEYKHYLRIACDKNIMEVRAAFDDELPEGLEPNEYYNYLTTKK